MNEALKALECIYAHFDGLDELPPWGEELKKVAADGIAALHAQGGDVRPTAPNELAELRGILEGKRKEPRLDATVVGIMCVEAHNAALNLALAEIDKMRGKRA